MTEFVCDHTFKTTIAVSKFEAVVTKACREPFQIELIAHDPGLVPAPRLFTVGFTTPEDRDRVRIAMRFVEKEQAATSPAPRTVAPLAGQLVSA
ncbi:MAG: hypothetical protein K2P94_19040 [Rhodospirillaceae bacterium]|nr:hypothetical protein [Rhodospirillaceae bacterium]